MWWFVSPRIAFGEDALDCLEEVKARKAVIVTDQGIRKVGFVERITSYLEKTQLKLRHSRQWSRIHQRRLYSSV